MEAAKIWLTAIIATIAYGIAHDLVTTRVSLEYFTIAHAGIFQTQSPTLLAFGWGIVATWWGGVLLGGLIALTARFGKRPKVALRDLARPGAILVLAIGVLSLIAGVAGYIAAGAGAISLSGVFAAGVPSGGAHQRFLAVAWAHTAAYGAGFVGASLFAAWIWIGRARSTSAAADGLAPSRLRAETA